MRIAAARLIPYRLPLKRPWTAAAATLVERRGMLVALKADGLTGWGDCAPLPSSDESAQARVFAALNAALGNAEGIPVDALRSRLAAIESPEARWALETALLDLEARAQGRSLASLLGAPPAPSVAVNAALGALDTGCAARAAAALARGYAIAKIKVGLVEVDVEIERLFSVQRETGGRLRLRLDANRAWSDADAWRFLSAVARLPIEGVEEPLAAPTLARLGRLQAALPFAIAIDESLPALGLDAILAARAVRRLVVKPARLGGIVATLELAERARRAGIEVVLTSVVDSAVGVAAAAHLAAALPGAGGLAHGLGTGEWLAEDVAPPLPIVDGYMKLADAPGLGFEPSVSV